MKLGHCASSAYLVAEIKENYLYKLVSHHIPLFKGKGYLTSDNLISYLHFTDIC